MIGSRRNYFSRALVFALLAGAVGLVLLISRSPACAQRYWAVRRDGSVQTGDQVRNWTERRDAALDGKPLIDTGNPVRMLRDTTLSIQPPREFSGELTETGFIELANGDRLFGRPQAIVLGQSALPWPDHLVLGQTLHSGRTRVRLDWVRRLVTEHDAARHSAPNTVRLRDGREIGYRSLRWSASGVRLLTDDGIEEVALESIAVLNLTSAPAMPPLPGAVFLDGQQPKLVRTVTADGEAFTHPHRMIAEVKTRRRRARSELGKRYATRPPWALDTIFFGADEIAWQTYLDEDERPLSLLPVVAQEHGAAVQHLPWRRNRNVHGQPLQCSNMASELGIGMHARSRITFALPEGAKSFSTQVGIDRLAAGGGCVHCRVYRDDETEPLWQREYLRGSDGVQQVGPLNVDGAQTLSLEVDFAHEGRPDGADPLDVRDWVNWLLPIVKVAPAEPRREEDVKLLAPEIEGWSIPERLMDELSLHPDWHEDDQHWSIGLSTGAEPLVLTRHVRVDLTNAWLHITAAAADMPGAKHEIRVTADGEKVGSTMNGPVRTRDKDHFNNRVHTLHEHAGQDVDLRITAHHYESNRQNMKAVLFRPLQLQPLILGLPRDGRPIEPDVPLTALEPLNATCGGKPLELRPGMVNEEEELNVRRWTFTEGYGVPTGSEITYRLDPAWKTFVAVIGLADGYKGAGPYQVFVDGEMVWSSQKTYARNDQGEQIAVRLPDRGRTITIKVLGDESGGALAHAGFLTH